MQQAEHIQRAHAFDKATKSSKSVITADAKYENYSAFLALTSNLLINYQ